MSPQLNDECLGGRNVSLTTGLFTLSNFSKEGDRRLTNIMLALKGMRNGSRHHHNLKFKIIFQIFWTNVIAKQ